MNITIRESTLILEGKSPLGNRLLKIFKKSLFSKATVVKWVMGQRKFTNVIDRYWYGGTNNKILIPKIQLNRLVSLAIKVGFNLSGSTTTKYKHISDFVELLLKDERQPFDYQQKHIDDIIKPETRRYLLGLKPGYGKTFTTIKSLSIIGGRTFVLVLAKYTDKWESDLRDGLHLEEGDILQVVGATGINRLLEMPKDELPKIIIASTRTMFNYFNTYLGSDKYASKVLPFDFANHLGLSNLVIDEAHNEFHVVYRTIISFDIKTIALSGTFTSRSTYVKKYMEDLFPPKRRVDYSNVKKFRHYIAVAYSLTLKDHEEEWVNGNMGYSQIKYEQLMFGNDRDRKWKELPPLKVEVEVNGKTIKRLVQQKYNDDYTDYMSKLLLDYFKTEYMDSRAPGDKIIIYNLLAHTCNHVTSLLQEHYPDLNIVKYMQDDSYDVIEPADVVVSTVLSSGEAFDIANLTRVFMFINTMAEVPNLQAAGRLRDIKGKEVKFYYFYNKLFKKHLQYHYTRSQLFKDQALTFKYVDYKG